MFKYHDISFVKRLVSVAVFAAAVPLHFACVQPEESENTDGNGVSGNRAQVNQEYFPPPEDQGGWRVADPTALGVDATKLKEAIAYHDGTDFTAKYGGAIVIIYQGHLIGESYATGTEDGPQPWTESTCNEMASSTKSVLGTAFGVFLDEYKDRVDLDTYLVGRSREESLIPHMWDQPITDGRKKQIKVKHVLSMTAGCEFAENFFEESPRHHYPGYSGAFQMFEYAFGWWYFDGIPSQHTLMFEPGQDFNYSSWGQELLGLAMRDISGEELGPFVYDRVLTHMGMPIGLRNNQPRELIWRWHYDRPQWPVGGSEGCNAFGGDGSASPYGVNTLATTCFRSTARDFARLGYLWLNKGRWGDRQLVPEEWMKTATSRFVREDGSTPNNYGYTFWVHDEWDNVPKDTFASHGAHLNNCWVVPSLDLVVVRQGGNYNPPRDVGSKFTETLMEKIVAAIPVRQGG